jgi:hypothetical protein
MAIPERENSLRWLAFCLPWLSLLGSFPFALVVGAELFSGTAFLAFARLCRAKRWENVSNWIWGFFSQPRWVVYTVIVGETTILEKRLFYGVRLAFSAMTLAKKSLWA